MNIMSAESPIAVNLRQVSFRPDADVRVFLDSYVATEGYEIKGYIQRLIRAEMGKVQAQSTAARPKAAGRKDIAQRASRGNRDSARVLVPIEEMLFQTADAN